MSFNPFTGSRPERRLRITRHPAWGKRPESIKPHYPWQGLYITCCAFSWVGGHHEPDLSIRERHRFVHRNHHTVIIELPNGRQVKRHIRKHRVLFETVEPAPAPSLG